MPFSRVWSRPAQRLGLCAAAFVLAGAAHAASVTPSVLYRFPLAFSNAEGTGPLAQGGDGRIFFATTRTLYRECGALQALDPATSSVVTLSIDKRSLGCWPASTLNPDAQGTLWGAMGGKGPRKEGSLFKIPPDGEPTLVHAYTAAEDWAGGRAPVPLADGSLRMGRGPLNAAQGQLERYAPPLFALEVYRTLTPKDKVSDPHLVLAHADGYLYGLGLNWPTHGHSVIRSNDAGELTALADLSGYGVSPDNPVDGGDGFLYVSLPSDTDGSLGRLLKISRQGAVTVLHEFQGPDGRYPSGSPIRARDGWLYGTAGTGGLHDAGVIYRLHTDGSAFETLYHFDNGPRGGVPTAALMQAQDGLIYGRTRRGGQRQGEGDGVVFRFRPPH